MYQNIKFNKAIEYFYNSLSQTIKERIKLLNLTRMDVIASDPTRVTDIVKNRRNKKHPYLIGEREYSKINNIFRLKTKEEIMKQGLNSNEFIKEVKEYGRDKRTGKMGMIEKKKFSDSANYDEMLWGHIDWEVLFLCILEDVDDLNGDDKLYTIFTQSLLNYVPYAIDYADFEASDNNPFSNYFRVDPPVYAPIEDRYAAITSKIETQKELIFGDEIFNQLDHNKLKAIDWVYMREKSLIVSKLQDSFLRAFRGKRLQKFDRQFDSFLFNFMSELALDRQPKKHSLGLEAYNYMKELLNIELMNENICMKYTELYRPDDCGMDIDSNFYPDYSEVGELREVDVLANYMEFTKKHLEGLQEFQLEFEKTKSKSFI